MLGWVAAVIVLANSLPGFAAADRAVQTAAVIRPGELPQASRSMIQPEQLRKVILRHLEQQFGGKVREVQVALIEPQQPIPMPAGRIEIAVLPSAFDEGLGRRVFHLQLSNNGRPVDTVEVVSDVVGYADLVVPARLIKTDEVIEPDDVQVSRMKLMDLRQQFMTDPNEVIGKSAVRPLQSQMPIRLASLKKPYAVRKGDRVTIEAKSSGLSIQAVGVTKAGAELGQMVTVTNSDSGKDLRAKVIAPGVVRVEF
jgi:flagella basal body P-ring formation protein FlgA